ncbi:GMP synthase-like glutamine amidotransferase [Aminobacter lissarensis]|uniref:GMP synthase-like glutamine amidotransferase n=1 Tax=Aminobacter carboxidus TaxID=376165 RepID=A0A8E1WHH6_9HYPH|nr:type 1 glutamine amidotransferase [Aminobacter lissarensis]MBB6468632.1 GMP synthase-like glutamine amidotransferase [Aminobacter lissarensis]
MHVLVVQNYEGTGLGQVGEALAEVEAVIDQCNAHLGDALPVSADGHDAMIMLGGGQNARDDAHSPHFPALLELARDFVEKDKAVLGICLGGQLLARAFGGHNRIGGSTEFGWHGITLTDEAQEDLVFSDLPQRFPIFQWHDDTFTLPADAVRLAGSSVTGNQAFRIGRAGYGIQFHFEADRPLVRQWNEAFAETISRRHPDWSERHEVEAARDGPEADAVGLTLARAWVAAI